jgi:small-conductance mechanosensitive channel
MAENIANIEQTTEAIRLEAQKVIEFVEYLNQLNDSSSATRFIIAGVITGIALFALLWVRVFINRRIKYLSKLPTSRFRPLRLQAQDLLSSEDMQNIWIKTWHATKQVLSGICILGAINGLLLASDWTLTLAAYFIALLLTPLKYACYACIAYLPNLLTIGVILLLTRFLIHIIGLIFEGIKTKRIRLPHFYPEWAETSYGIVKIIIYAIAVVLIFPYFPGSSSPAFRGISIFVGLLVSLGSTTAVANIVAGIVLTYTRAFHIGDQVMIADKRGRIVERSTFVTRIQTLKNVVVSIPNSVVLNNNMTNYSKNMGTSGLLVHTSITIGYDVPWQTVNKLLIEAALRTNNINPQPEPFVLQTSLDDNYVCYEINGWTQAPELLTKTYSSLHANILDCFHQAGVEITSPAYRATRDGNPPAIPTLVTAPDDSDDIDDIDDD